MRHLSFRNIFILGFSILILNASSAFAAVVTWTGGGSDNKWSTAANWSTGTTTPTASDIATFNNTSTKVCTVDADVNVAGIAIAATYSGTIRQLANITVGSSNYSQAAGTFIGDRHNMTINGTYALSAGTFTCPSGTLTVTGNFTISGAPTFNHNNGTVVFSGASSTVTPIAATQFYNVTIAADDGAVITIVNSISVTSNGTLTLTDGKVNQTTIPATGTLAVKGNIVQDPTYDGGTGIVFISGTGPQNFTGNCTRTDGLLNVLNINKASGTLTLQGTIRSTSNTTWTAGTVAYGSSTFVIVPNGQTITGTFGLGNIIIDPNNDSNTVLTIGATLTVNGNLLMDNTGAGNITINTGTLSAKGGVTIDDRDWSAGTATLLLNGQGDQTMTGGQTQTTGAIPIFTINKPSGILYLAGTIRTVKAWTYTLSGGIEPGTSIVVFVPNGQTVTGTQYLGNVTIDPNSDSAKTLTFAASMYLYVKGDLVLTNSGSGAVNINTATSYLSVWGNVNISNHDYSGSTAWLQVSGYGDQTITGNNTQTSGFIPQFHINKPSGALTFNGTIRTKSAWTYSQGQIDPNSGTIVFVPNSQTITGAHILPDVIIDPNNASPTTLTIAAATTVTVGGDLTMTNSNTGAVTLTTTGNLAVWGNITVDNLNYSAGTCTLLINGPGDQIFTGNHTQTSGLIPILNISKPSGNLTMSGTIRSNRTWTWTSGYIKRGTSTMVFVPNAQTITGNCFLDNVVIDPNSLSATTLTVANTVTAAGDLTLYNSAGTAACTINTGNLGVWGNVSVDNNIWTGTGSVMVTGTAEQSVSCSMTRTTGTLPRFNVSKLYGNLNFSGFVRTQNIFTWTSGYMNSSGATLVLAANTVNGNMTWLGDLIIDSNSDAASTETITNTLTVEGSVILENSAGGNISINTGYLAAHGDIVVDGKNWSGGTGTLSINGMMDQSITQIATRNAGALPIVNINKNAGTLFLSGILRTVKAWTWLSGIIDPGSSTMVFVPAGQTVTGAHTLNNVIIDASSAAATTLTLSNLTIKGSMKLGNTLAGLMTVNGGTISLYGDVSSDATVSLTGTTALTLIGEYDQNINIASFGAGAVTINKTGGTAKLVNNLVLNGTAQPLNVTAGTLDLNGYNLTLNATGTWVMGAAGILKSQGGETVSKAPTTMTAGSTFHYYGSSPAYTLRNYAYSTLILEGGASTVWSLPASIVSFVRLDIRSGILSCATYNLTATTLLNNGTLRLGGDETVTITNFPSTSGLVEYTATSGTRNIKAFPYYNLKINGTGGTFTLPGATVVNGTLEIAAGTLSPVAQNLSVAGNFINTGTFTAGTGTVILNGSTANQRVTTGISPFYNLTITNTSSWGVTFTGNTTVAATFNDSVGSRLTFNAGSLFTVTTTLTLAGQIGHPVIMRSSSDGSPWYFKVSQASPTASYVDVKDSNASAGNTIVASNSVDSTGNTNWTINANGTISGVVYQSNGSTPIATTRKVVLRINGALIGTVQSMVTTGVYSFSGLTINPGDVITLYLSDEAEKANTVTVAYGNIGITSVPLIATKVVVRSDNGFTPLTIADMAVYDSSDDSANMVFTASLGSPNTLTVNSGVQLYVNSAQDIIAPNGNTATSNSGLILKGRWNESPGDVLTINGSFDSTGGTFNRNGGTVVFAASGSTFTVTQNFNNVTFDPNSSSASVFTIAAGTVMNVYGTLTLTNSQTAGAVSILTGTLNASSDVYADNVDYGGSTTAFQITGTSEQTLTGACSRTTGSLPILTINKTSGILRMAGTIRTYKNLTWTAGSIEAVGSEFVFAPPIIGQTITGNIILGDVIVDSNSDSVNSLTIANTLTALGTLTLSTSGTGLVLINTGNIVAKGNIYTGYKDWGAGTLASITISGAGDQTWTANHTQTSGGIPPLIINKTSGTLTFSGTLRTYKNWTWTAGSVEASNSTVVFVPTKAGITVAGTHALGNIIIDPNNPANTILTIGAATTVLTANGDLVLDNSGSGNITLNTGTLAVNGDLTVDDRNWGLGTSPLLICGRGDQTWTSAAGRLQGNIPAVIIQKLGGTLFLSGTIRSRKNWTYLSGLIDPGTSTVIFIPMVTTTTIAGTFSLNNIIIDPNDFQATTITVSNTITANGDLTLDNSDSGYVVFNTGNIAVNGDLTVDDRIWSGTGTVLVNGAGDQMINQDAARTRGTLPNINIFKYGGTLSFSSIIRTAYNWTYTMGDLNTAGTTFVFAFNGTTALTITGNHTLGDIIFDPDSSLLSSYTIAANTCLTSTGTLTLQNSDVGDILINCASANSLVAKGDVFVGNNDWSGGTATLTIAGNSDQTITGDSSRTTGGFPIMVILKPAGTLRLVGTLRFPKAVTWTVGSLDAGNSTVVLVPNGQTTTIMNLAFGNVIIDAYNEVPVTLTLGGSMIVNGSLIIENSLTAQMTINTGTIVAKGDIYSDWTFANASTAPIQLIGNGDQNLRCTSLGNGLITVSKTGGTARLLSDMILTGSTQGLTIALGTFDLNGYNLTISGSGALTVGAFGTMKLQGSEVINKTPTITAGGTVYYTGTAPSYILNNYTYSNLTIDGGATSVFSFPANLTVNTLNLLNGITYINGYNLVATAFKNNATLRLKGAETVTLTNMDTASGTVEYVGDNDGIADTFTIKDFGPYDYYSLSLSAYDGILDTFRVGASDLDMTGALILNNGSFEMSTNNPAVTISGDISLNAGNVLKGTNTVLLDGAQTYADNIGTTLGRIEIGRTSNSAVLLSTLNCDSLKVNAGNTLFTGGKNIDCAGHITIEGVVDAARSGPDSSVIYVAGNWYNTGTLVPDNSRIVFDGTNQSINGSASFYGLQKTTAVNDTLFFDDAGTQTITGFITLEGDSGHTLTLKSDVDGVQFGLKLSQEAVNSVYYVDVKDADSSGGPPFIAMNSVNSLNNTNWIFPVDSGLRYHDGIQTIIPACENSGSLLSSLRIRKGATTYGVVTVPVSDPHASKLRINTPAGPKAVRKYE